MHFKHYIITRFNLRTPDWDLSKNQELVLTDEWMTHRMELFEHICLPSIVSQTNQHFSWLLYFDTETSLMFRKKIEAITKKITNVRVCYIDGMPSFKSSLIEHIRTETRHIPYIISTRLDNDDCLHQDFVKTIQEQFDFQDFMAIDCTKGYSLQLEPEVLLGKKTHLYNPFISLIEKNRSPSTVCMRSHTEWKREHRVKQINDKRLWLSVIHQKNKMNRFNGYGKVDWRVLKNFFSVSDVLSAYILVHSTPTKKWKFLSLKNQLTDFWISRSKRLKKILGMYRSKKH